MGLPARRLACAGVLAALGALARWSTATARRGGERPRRHAEPQNGIPLSNALAPENLRRWVSSQRGVRAWTDVTTHSRTTGYRSSAGELVWLDGRRRGKICATAELPEVEVAALHWTSYSQRAWRPGGRLAPSRRPTSGARCRTSTAPIARRRSSRSTASRGTRSPASAARTPPRTRTTPASSTSRTW